MDALKNLNLNNIDLNNIDLSKLKVNTQGYDAVELSPEHEEMIRGVGQMIDDVQKSGVLTCDKECQRNKKEQLLYDDYLNAKQNAQQAPIVLEEAERNFYEYSKGTSQYNKLKEKEYTKDATAKANQIAKEYLVKLENTLELYKQYQTQQTYLSNMETTKSVLQEKVTSAEKEISDYKNTRELNDRMDTYTQDKIGWSTWISKILNIVYYLLASAFGFTFIFLNKQYTNKKLWAITIALLLYPTVSSFIFDQIKRRL